MQTLILHSFPPWRIDKLFINSSNSLLTIVYLLNFFPKNIEVKFALILYQFIDWLIEDIFQPQSTNKSFSTNVMGWKFKAADKERGQLDCLVGFFISITTN